MLIWSPAEPIEHVDLDLRLTVHLHGFGRSVPDDVVDRIVEWIYDRLPLDGAGSGLAPSITGWDGPIQAWVDPL